MAFRNLTPLEIRDLIAQYQSDLRKLHFQTQKVNQIIAELQSYTAEAEEAYAIEEPTLRELPSATYSEEPKKKKPGKSKRKTRKGTAVKPPSAEEVEEAAPSTEKRGPGRPPKGSKPKKKQQPKGKGYRLSEWDLFVMQSLDKGNKSMITSDFVDAAQTDETINLGPTEIKIKLNRSLHKLANKKGLLVKVEHEGRGFAYAKQEWLNSRGELPKKYAR
jgi:hypothetical protein